MATRVPDHVKDAIYRLYHEEGVKQVKLAELFGVSQSYVSNVINGRSASYWTRKRAARKAEENQAH